MWEFKKYVIEMENGDYLYEKIENPPIVKIHSIENPVHSILFGRKEYAEDYLKQILDGRVCDYIPFIDDNNPPKGVVKLDIKISKVETE